MLFHPLESLYLLSLWPMCQYAFHHLNVHAWIIFQKNKWVTLDYSSQFPVRPTKFFGITWHCTKAKVTHCFHTHRHTQSSFWPIITSLLWGETLYNHYLVSINKWAQFEDWHLASLSCHVESIPSPHFLSLSLSASAAQSDHWTLVPTTSSAPFHKLQRYTCDIINLSIKRYVCTCKCIIVSVFKGSQNRCHWAAVCSFPVWLTVGVTLPSLLGPKTTLATLCVKLHSSSNMCHLSWQNAATLPKCEDCGDGVGGNSF